EDMYIVKTDAAGNVEWEETYGGSNPDYGYDVEEFTDSYVAVGYTASSEIMTGGGGDLMMVKIMKPAAPLAPVLLAPRNDSLNVPVAATLRWQGSGGASRYRLQVATDNLFANLVVDDSTVSGTSRAIASLQSSTRYYW
ncbi:hypothetical protein, partial [Bradyrhizobium sp. NBAIM08]|uniref:hypothetical protein n=1 Tax=Bradyrhizobium sp. NBAIM08 TaxID=2793815 RepID=UPI001CD55E7F